jgi:hypothetical protein
MNTDNFYSKDVQEVKSVTVPSNLSYIEAMNDVEEVTEDYENKIKENKILKGIILKILDARTRGQALIPNDIYESIVEHLNLYTE